MNELHDAKKPEKGKDVSDKMVNGLIPYTAMYFSTEEKYVDQYGCLET